MECYCPARHKVKILLGGSRYVGTVEKVAEAVATGNVWLEDVTLLEAGASDWTTLDAPVLFSKEQPFHVLLVDSLRRS